MDSGASYSIFSSNEAEKLRIDFKQGLKTYIIVGDGSFIPVYQFKVLAKIGGFNFLSIISFSDKLGVWFNLLGRKSFFEEFDVTFSDSKGIITFQKVEKQKR